MKDKIKNLMKWIQRLDENIRCHFPGLHHPCSLPSWHAAISVLTFVRIIPQYSDPNAVRYDSPLDLAVCFFWRVSQLPRHRS